MSIRNKKLIVFLPLASAVILVIGMYIGVKLDNSAINERLLIYPRTDKVNAVLNLIDDAYVDTISRNKLEEAAINRILENLDPHSIYIPAEELQAMNEPLEGNFSGIGIQFNIQSDTIIVVSTIANGPSERVGIKPGDRIVRVNDSLVARRGLNSDMVVKKLKGEKGSKVKVSVKRNGFADLINFIITRDVIPIYSIDASYMIAPATGYIKVNKFAKTTYDEFITAVKGLQKNGMKKLIVDLRGNGGGLLDIAIKITDEFLDANRLIVYTEGRSRPRTNSYSTKGGICLKDSLVVLIDEYTASASEIFAGAIQDNDRGMIIGRRSFGKGLVQEQSPLPGGAAIRLTIARYYTPTGRSIQKSYKNGTRNYYDELQQRYAHGEFKQADSTKFNDSLKFTTPRGRVVYGGGGIMPDIFVPLDTTWFSEYFYKVREKGWIYQFAFQYSDMHRAELLKLKSYLEIEKYLTQKNILKDFTLYAAKNGIRATPKDLRFSGAYLQNQLEALIVRNFFDNNGFYPVINAKDNTVQKAINYLNGK
jgi:carboxyl-terminal processing protease